MIITKPNPVRKGAHKCNICGMRTDRKWKNTIVCKNCYENAKEKRGGSTVRNYLAIKGNI